MGATVPHFPPRKTGTCSVWALGMWLSSGGKMKPIRSSHYRWLFRVLWSPDGEEWFGYVPLHPIPRLARDASWHQRCVHNLRVFKHSLWFEGRVRREPVDAGGSDNPARSLIGDECRHLAPKEFAILTKLVERPGKPVRSHPSSGNIK